MTSTRQAYFVGGGIGSLAAAAFHCMRSLTP
jgi:myosin-crossreactive antigen